MRTKLLFLLVVFAMSNTLFSQTVGDYRSAGPGPAPWNNAASWQRYVGPNPVTDWVASTNYPGQIAGSYNVVIRTNHTISNPNVLASFGELVIDGTLFISTNQHVYLSPNSVTVTNLSGQIYFQGQGDLHLPASTSLTVFPPSGAYQGGLPDGMTNCSASKRIWFGDYLFSNCNGAGEPVAFQELMAANGSLVGVVNVEYNCDTAVLTPSHIGLLKEGTSAYYQMTVTAPNNVVILSTYEDSGLINYPSNNSYLIEFDIVGTYIITLIFNVDYDDSGIIPYTYDNTRIIELHSAFNWNGTKWTPFTPSIGNRVVLNGNYNTGTNGSFSACSLVINPVATVNISPNTYIETEYDVTNNGILNIESSGSLVQKDNAASFTAGTNGTSKVTRQSRAMKGNDYVYWGSPVKGTIPLNLVPNTTYFNRFHKWNLSGLQLGTWGNQITDSPAPGNGFIARVNASYVASQGGTIAPTQFEFSGSELNSGLISVNANVYGNSSTGWETANGNTVLLGNPYPSAISAEALVMANDEREMGTLFFWTSVTVFNQTGNGQYNVMDYASWNLSGSSAPESDETNDDLNPQGYIASGQGFFAQVFTVGDVVFNNNMRVRDNNAQFFRTAEGSSSEVSETEMKTEKHRIWVNLSNGKDAYRQLLMGYIEGATNDFDYQYDGASFTTNEIDIYTLLENKELAIQGRALPFVTEDIIPIGYRITNPGIYAVNLGATDGLFAADQDVYLYDKTTNTLHNLKKGPYEFHAQSGTFNNRFEIHFREQALENNPIASENNFVIFGANKALNINSYESNIQSVELFDLVGKRIFSASDLNVEHYVSPSIHAAGPFFIARVTLSNNQVITKKVIIK